jgi:molybdopterin synthase sulfur carrier subunit
LAVELALVLFFGPAREAAGTGRSVVPGASLEEVVAGIRSRFGPALDELLSVSRVWLNGAPADPATPVGPDDEVAILPPVSGG